MNRLKVVIIEDELLAQQRLLDLLKEYDRQIEIIGTARNGNEGLELVQKASPDVIFLDIQMPLLTGFEMLNKLQNSPKVVFVTAFEEYALKAFEENSVDYLLKPVSKKRLKLTIDKLNLSTKDEISWDRFESTLLQYKSQQQTTPIQSITVTKGNNMKILKLTDVAFFHAEDKYIMVHEVNGNKYILSQSLKAMEEKMPSNFFRVHRAYLINFDSILEIKKDFRSYFVFHMNDSTKSIITCGNSYIKPIKEKLDI